MSVGAHPKLEFVDSNVILVNWMPHHFAWHHYGPKDRRTQYVIRRIEELWGETWEEMEKHLLIVEKTMQRHDEFYLRMLIASFENELGARGEGK